MQKIVLAISSEKLCEDIKNMLVQGGYQVRTAREVNGLFRLLRTEQYDLCLLDQDFKGMNLRELSLQIESDFLVPVVITANIVDGLFLQWMEELKLGLYYQKPFQATKLYHFLWMALQMKKRIIGLESQMEKINKQKWVTDAKMMLMMKSALTEEEAYELLRSHSMKKRIKIEEVAQEILRGNWK